MTIPTGPVTVAATTAVTSVRPPPVHSIAVLSAWSSSGPRGAPAGANLPAAMPAAAGPSRVRKTEIDSRALRVPRRSGAVLPTQVVCRNLAPPWAARPTTPSRVAQARLRAATWHSFRRLGRRRAGRSGLLGPATL